MRETIVQIRNNFVNRLCENAKKYGQANPVIEEDFEILDALNKLAKLAEGTEGKQIEKI